MDGRRVADRSYVAEMGMSQNALWIALSVDWADSPMLDGLTPSARLAWVCLLCEAKAKGRGGMVRIRASKFAATYNLEPACVDEMIEAAKGGGAIIQDRDGSVEIVNWRKYQHKASKAESRRQKFPAPEKVQKVPTGQDRTGQDRSPPPFGWPPRWGHHEPHVRSANRHRGSGVLRRTKQRNQC